MRYGLSSGLGVVVVPTKAGVRDHAEHGTVEMWLIVRAGTMDERENERGVSYIAERLARMGSDRFARDEIDAMLASGGDKPNPARTMGSLVTLDQTIFMGRAVAGDPESVRALLGYYASVLEPGALGVSPERVDAARAEVVGKYQAMMSPELRARQRWLPRLLGEEGLGTMARFPDAQQLNEIGVEDVAAFIDRGYRASRSTLLVVGDTNGLELDALIAQSLGTLGPRDRGAVSDLRGRLGGSRFVMGLDPDMEQHQVAMVWANPIKDACLEPWGVRASRFEESDLREMVLDRVVMEVVRHRLERLLMAELGSGVEVVVSRFELAAQVELLQCVIERDGVSDEHWSRSLRALVMESDRLALGRVAADEIARARGALLARWHREALEWESMPVGERVWLTHWLLTSGRPVMSARVWDQRATRLIAEISDAQVNRALRSMLDPAAARALAVTRGEPGDGRSMDARVRAAVDEARDAGIEPIEPDWMVTLGGSLFDGKRFDARIERVTQHAPSGTWGATLGNGVRVWARGMGDDGREQRVEISAMLWGPMFGDGSLREGEIEAAMLAWSTPSSEARDSGWLAVYCESRGIKVRPRRVVGGIRVEIESPADDLDAAIRLLYLLLDRPMIDAEAHEQWLASPKHRWQPEPLERALATLYNPGRFGDENEPAPSLDDAQRALTRIVREAQIGIGVAGPIDAGDMLERAGSVLGELAPRRTEPAPGAPGVDDAPRPARVMAREVEVVGHENELVSGVLGGSVTDLDRLRATILASMVMQDHARALVRERGLAVDDADVQVVMSDTLGDRWVLWMRAEGEDAEGALSAMRQAGDDLLSGGIDPEALARVQHQLVRSLDRYFDNPGYWSSRLSGVGMRGRSVDDIWSIREGYQRIGAQEATRALRAALDAPDVFRIRVVEQERPSGS